MRRQCGILVGVRLLDFRLAPGNSLASDGLGREQLAGAGVPTTCLGQ